MDELIAVIAGTVPAGFPSPALDYHETRIDLTKQLVTNELSTFLVGSSGDSMLNSFIPPKAMLLVDRSRVPVNGDIVLAVINGEFTVKHLKKNAFKQWLVPGNRLYPDIEITAEMDLVIWGVVTYIITDTKELRRCMR